MNKNDYYENNIKKEQEIFEKIQSYVNAKDIMIYNAGAGAGKTYDLIRTVNYIVENNFNELETNSNKVLCITYTNSAKDEVLNRLGSTTLVHVSTIHDVIWNIIKDYPQELLIEHELKIKNEISKNDETINGFEVEYVNISKDEFNKIFEKFNTDKNLEVFYTFYNEKAITFREKIKDLNVLNESDLQLLKNVGKFKKWINTRHSNYKLNNALQKLDKHEVTYTPLINRDRLELFNISHDTVLEYANAMTQKYNNLKLVIASLYPYILLDEYQDTNPKIIELFEEVYFYAKKRNSPIFYGLFGDHKQSIYESAIGSKLILCNRNSKYKIIEKNINRRSNSKIVEIGNFFRDDNLKQIPLHCERDTSFENSINIVFVHTEEFNQINTSYLIEKLREKWDVGQEKVVSLQMRNSEIAKYKGFGKIFDWYNQSSRYNFATGRNLAKDLMSKEFVDLAYSVGLFLRLYMFKRLISAENTGITDIFPSKYYKGEKALSYTNMEKILNIINGIEWNDTTINELIDIVDSYDKYKYKNIYTIIRSFLNLEQSKDSIKNEIVKSLNELVNNRLSQDERNVIIQEFLDIRSSEFESHLDSYLRASNEESFVTLHGSKGLEFENVIVFLSETFNKIDIKNILMSYINNEYILDKKEEKIKNLLYVAVTRAKNNLAIVLPPSMSSDDVKKIADHLGEIKLINPL